VKQPRDSKPVIRPVPPLAPDGHVTLITVLQEMGKVDTAWTGEELLAEPVTELSDEEFGRRAFVIFSHEIANNLELARHEDAIQAELRERYEEEIAPRLRRQAVVRKCLELLYRRVLPSIAFGFNGKIYDVPNDIWAAEGAEEVFDTGILLVRGKKVRFQKGLTQGDNTAIVLVKAVDLDDVVKRLSAGECLATLASPPERTGTSSPETGHPYPYRSGYPGRFSLKDLIRKEFTRRVDAGEYRETLRDEARHLREWVGQAHPDAPQLPTERTIENQIRDLYRRLVREQSTK